MSDQAAELRSFTRGDHTGKTWQIPQPKCTGCDKKPEQLAEYQREGKAAGMSPSAFVVLMEGTLNYANGHFLCTPCYVKAGSPHGRGFSRWVAP